MREGASPLLLRFPMPLLHTSSHQNSPSPLYTFTIYSSSCSCSTDFQARTSRLRSLHLRPHREGWPKPSQETPPPLLVDLNQGTLILNPRTMDQLENPGRTYRTSKEKERRGPLVSRERTVVVQVDRVSIAGATPPDPTLQTETWALIESIVLLLPIRTNPLPTPRSRLQRGNVGLLDLHRGT